MRRPLMALLAVGLLSAAGAQAQRGWATVSPPDMGFRAVFPREPEHYAQSNRTESGTWVGTTWEVDDVVRDRAFQVTVKDYSRYDTAGASIDAVLDAMCRGHDPNAEIHSLPASVPARRCTSERGVGGTEMRVFWVAPRLYVASHICGRQDCTSDRTRFFGGFQLVR